MTHDMERAVEQAAQAIRRTREFQAGAAFGVPEVAYEAYTLGIARALAAAGLLACGEDEDTSEPVREEWSTYDPNNTGMWGRTNFRADSEEQARELAFKFGYEVHRRFVSGETKTRWERVE